MTQATLLIVDDEKHTRDGLRRLLEDQYDVYVAADIAGAMDVLEREQIDVLITDAELGSHFRALAAVRPKLSLFKVEEITQEMPRKALVKRLRGD